MPSFLLAGNVNDCNVSSEDITVLIKPMQRFVTLGQRGPLGQICRGSQARQNEWVPTRILEEKVQKLGRTKLSDLSFGFCVWLPFLNHLDSQVAVFFSHCCWFLGTVKCMEKARLAPAPAEESWEIPADAGKPVCPEQGNSSIAHDASMDGQTEPGATTKPEGSFHPWKDPPNTPPKD